MATVHYPAIIERAGDSYSVFFPDLPGCTSAGATLQAAALNAEEALNGHLAVSREHGDVVPDPSELDTVERDPEVDEVARILVRGERPGRAVRVQVSIDEGLLARIDRVAPNRSAFLAAAARAVLKNDAFVTNVDTSGAFNSMRSAILGSLSPIEAEELKRSSFLKGINVDAALEGMNAFSRVLTGNTPTAPSELGKRSFTRHG